MLKNKKVLIIGVGTVGSSLAKILTRTGILSLGLSDFDFVEVGNICRGEFSMMEMHLPKTFAVKNELEEISPFIEVSEISLDKIKTLDTESIKQSRDKLNQFDLIFNCTADNELIYAIDIIKPTGTVINLSITNKAKKLMCLTGNNIMEQLQEFNSDSTIPDIKFFEGTGCWSWTFEASYFDINAMLHLAVKNINNRFSQEKKLKSFIVEYEGVNHESLKVYGV
jgi:hypothetical protein